MRAAQSATPLVAAALLLLCVSTAYGLNPHPFLSATNPLRAEDFADVDVLRVPGMGEGGTTLYFATHTTPCQGCDFPLFTSYDLVNWRQNGTLLGFKETPGQPVVMGGYTWCWLWAAELRTAGLREGFIMTFTASRFNTTLEACPGYDEGSGTFVAWAPTPFGPFNTEMHTADEDHARKYSRRVRPTLASASAGAAVSPPRPHAPVALHPQAMGASLDPSVCPRSVHDSLPFARDVDTPNCGPVLCNNTMRLDSELFNDPLTHESWFAYAWYSNSMPQSDADRLILGEHVSIVQVIASNPMLVECDPARARKVWAVSPHDTALLDRLNASCARCGENLSFFRGRQNETMNRNGTDWGVAEGPMLFRRGEYVYLLASHSAWDSAWYSVLWIAARSVPELDLSNPNRLVGRFLIPTLDQSFGHGSAVLGPDGQHWYFLHHHLNHTACHLSGDCHRDLYISPIEFEDRGDGLGDVHIKPFFPAEQRTVTVWQPRSSEQEQQQPQQEEVELGARTAVDSAEELVGIAGG